jgi:hypothetical protein
MRYKRAVALCHTESGITIDLQTGFAQRHYGIGPPLGRVWPALETMELGRGTVRVLPACDALVQLAAHAARHGWRRMGWVCDLAESAARATDDAWPAILFRARELGLERCLLTGLSLARSVLEQPLSGPVRGRLQADPVAARLAASASALYPEVSPPARSARELVPFFYRSRERRSDRLRFLLLWIVTPTVRDLSAVRLPAGLSFLYYLVRPVRVACRYARRILP